MPDHRPTRRLQLAILIGGVAALCLIWAGIAYHLALRQETIRQQAHRDVLNLSRGLEQQVERLIANVDQVMRFIQDDFATSGPESFVFDVWVRRATSLQSVVHQISMYDARGEFLASKTPLPPAMPRFHVRDRAYFQALAGQPGAGLYIDRTLAGRITGRRVLQMVRRLDLADGSFAGVLVVSVDPDYLAQQFSGVDVGALGDVALFGRDGYIRARHPVVDGMYDRDAHLGPNGSDLFASIERGPVGSYEAMSADGGIARIVGYRAFSDHPLVIVVGKSLDEVMMPFHTERHRVIAVGAVTTLLLMAALALLVLELEGRRHRRIMLVEAHEALASKEALLRQANQFHAAAERLAKVGHWHFEPGNPTMRWSDELYRIFEIAPGTFVPSHATFGAMLHPEDVERIDAWWRGELAAGDGTPCEHRIVTPKGETKVILVRSLIQRDAGGRVLAMVGAVLDVTEHRQAQADVVRTSALLSRTLDCMDQGLILVGGDGTVEVANRRAMELLDLPEAVLAARPSYREFRNHVRRAKRWGRLVSDGPVQWPFDGEARGDSRSERRNEDGQVLEVRTIPTDDGGMIQTFTDITDQKRAEDRYRLLAENASDLIVLKPSFQGRRSYVSPSSPRVVGWEPEELTHLPPEGYIHPEDFARVSSEFASLTKAEPRLTSEHRLRHKGGHYIWVEAEFHLTNAGMPDQAVVVTARDVGARRAADIALRESEVRHRILAETTSDIIARLDLDGKLHYLSPAVATVVGYAPEEMLGRKAADFIHSDDVQDVLEKFRTLVVAGPGARAKFEYRMRHKDGRYIWLEVNPSVLFDEATGRPLGIIDIARDVTVRKATEAALLDARRHTEAARLQAEQANQAKTDFLAAMSHEIRTPLNSVIGYTDFLLDDTSLASEQRILVERIQFAGSALLTVVNDILDFSKIEAGRVDLDLKTFALDALVDSTATMVRGLAERKGLSLQVVMTPGLPSSLVADEGRLRQILLNFLNNAVKFTRRGGVILSVERIAGPGATSDFRFAVSDTGIGIPKDQQDLLFRRFSQVDGSIRREFGGTGLGLAISKSLVEAMGGRVGVDSVSGEGSSFWFSVPLPEGDEEALPAPAPKVLAGPSLQILLVEDVEINQELARAVLERGGHEVDIATNGFEAVAAVYARRYDLILMDVQMPGMDGITATRHIRMMERPDAAIPIIAMTANVMPAQVAEFRAAGMNDHVGKPFRREELFAAIHRVIHRVDGAVERSA
ncbi:MAG: PAS domain S-box protein [Methylobacterium sp.]|uniref:PAS domain S-box protein n=1 Tax=Methylobacterium sp. TaxID=409 RepID=UPI0025CE1E51|nr:PAS domain S-box protein [Methylobacterium sp.]MBX9931375.1 PAS domain S-box protein [Methylobacterium sp.]